MQINKKFKVFLFDSKKYSFFNIYNIEGSYNFIIFDIKKEIDVIYNFVDVSRFSKKPIDAFKKTLAPNGERVLIHASNFRKIKRVDDVIKIFSAVNKVIPSKLMMVGDGLNDAGALAQSNIGISISENVNVFSPACDGILDASQFDKIAFFMKYSKNAMKTIYMSFGLSLLYNVVGLS